MGVWQQLKTIPPAKAALQAVYSIVTGFKTDFYFQVCGQMLNTTTTTYEAFKGSIISKLSHLSEDIQLKMYNDPSIGFITYIILLNPKTKWRSYQISPYSSFK